jgi:flagellar basal-body rod protein FlgG
MIRGIYTNAGSMLSLQLKQEITANNLANSNSTGFKKDGVFRKYLIDHDTILRQNASDFRHLEEVDGVEINFKQGELYATGNSLDTAIEGKGFFTIQTPDGIRYTRNGNFSLNQDGFIITSNGHYLLGNNGPIQALGDKIFIGDDGNITVDDNLIDVLRMADFPEPYVFNKIGNALFEAEDGTENPPAAGSFNIRQGFLEESNVEMIQEMVNMIQITRDFDSNQKSITMQDTTLDRAVNDIGRVQR